VTWRANARHETQHAQPQYSIDFFSIEHLSEGICNSRKNLAGYDQVCALVVLYITRRFRRILMGIKFSLQIFEKYLDIKFYGSMSSGSRVFFHADGRTDRHGGTNYRFSQFIDRA
jgi:hypothetical protein